MDKPTLLTIDYNDCLQVGRGKGGKAGGSKGGSRSAGGGGSGSEAETQGLGLANRGRSPNSPLSDEERAIASRALARNQRSRGANQTEFIRRGNNLIFPERGTTANIAEGIQRRREEGARLERQMRRQSNRRSS